MRLSLRSVLIALIALVAVGGLIAALDSKRSVSNALSSTGKGSVQLVVEFGKDSNMRNIDVQVTDFAGTGWQLLEQAGFDVEGTADYPTSFVCRLDGWPTHQMEPCVNGPYGRTGHWSYWVTNAELGNGWIMSGIGAAAHRSKCGQSEAWIWVPAGEGSDQAKPKTPIRVAQCNG